MSSCIVIVALIVVFSAAGALVAQVLWNALIPDLFHGPTVTYWQAWGLIFLVGLLGGLLRGSKT